MADVRGAHVAQLSALVPLVMSSPSRAPCTVATADRRCHHPSLSSAPWPTESRHPPIVLVTAALFSGPDLHQGSVAGTAAATAHAKGLAALSHTDRTVEAIVVLAARATALWEGGPYEVHALVDVPENSSAGLSRAERQWRARRLHQRAPLFIHRFPPSKIPGSELRFEHAAAVLRSRAWECAFLFDIADVSLPNSTHASTHVAWSHTVAAAYATRRLAALCQVHPLRIPPCSELPPRLLMASDYCTGGSNVRNLIRGAMDVNRAAIAALSPTRRAALLEWLTTRGAPKPPTLNCGIIGGSRSVSSPDANELTKTWKASWRVARALGSRAASRCSQYTPWDPELPLPSHRRFSSRCSRRRSRRCGLAGTTARVRSTTHTVTCSFGTRSPSATRQLSAAIHKAPSTTPSKVCSPEHKPPCPHAHLPFLPPLPSLSPFTSHPGVHCPEHERAIRRTCGKPTPAGDSLQSRERAAREKAALGVCWLSWHAEHLANVSRLGGLVLPDPHVLRTNRLYWFAHKLPAAGYPVYD